MSVILMTGCSTEIGQEAALHMEGRGHKVFASCRNPASATQLQQRMEELGREITLLPLELMGVDYYR